MAYVSYDSLNSGRPDRPLVVKCTFDRWNKRITFSSARNCSYELLRNKVEQCFALSQFSYTIAYKDDDGEITDITTESDLTEAIQYFQAGVDDVPSSSAASILSGRSFGSSRRITLRVHINVDYDGPSLSDTSSLASMEEYRERNRSEFSLSFSNSDLIDQDDDSVTVSSRDTGFLVSRPTTSAPRIGMGSSTSRSMVIPSALQEVKPESALDTSSLVNYDAGLDGSLVNGSAYVGADATLPSDPTAVFERLKAMEARNQSGQPSPINSNLSSQWLREQSARTLNGIAGPIQAPSTEHSFDGASLSTESIPEEPQDQLGLDGDLALQQDLRGKYYYTYTAGSSAASQTHDSGYDESIEQEDADNFTLSESLTSGDVGLGVSSSVEDPLLWSAQKEASKRSSSMYPSSSSSTSSRPPVRMSISDPLPRDSLATTHMYHDIPPEVLQFLPHTPLPPDQCTDCSECGVILDSFRYVCSTCGEKAPKPQSISGNARMFEAQQQQWLVSNAIENSESSKSSSSSSSSSYGKGKATDWEVSSDVMNYPPRSFRTNPQLQQSTSSMTLRSDGIEFTSSTSPNKSVAPSKPLPQLPTRGLSLVTAGYPLTRVTTVDIMNGNASSNGITPVERGYELCVSCIEHAGVIHALSESGGRPGVNALSGLSRSGSSGSSPSTVVPGGGVGGSSPVAGTPPSPEETLSQWRRSAPKRKGHFRHAYIEMVWGAEGWKNVEQDEIGQCSTCNTALTAQRFKCASCPKFNLCRGCYSQVHEIHPSHAFLLVPDVQLQRSRSEPELSHVPAEDALGEESLTHPGVKCAHCFQDIVGARFHCAICDNVDICSNCESAGLPGNLDAPEGGHDSSHIMIKIPYPLKSTEVQTASRRALRLWTGRDAPNLTQRRAGSNGVNPTASSLLSDEDGQTVIGSRNGGTSNTGSGVRALGVNNGNGVRGDVGGRNGNAHRLFCNGCSNPIFGVRYQCATCPSSPLAYSLCAKCEVKSYALHDPMHAFLKLPRPVDQPIASRHALLPILYRVPVGPALGNAPVADPKAYLQNLQHQAAVCDRCFELIRGPWFHCIYCAKDYCEDCETLDAHDPTHIYLVFKSHVEMQLFRLYVADPEHPRVTPPIVPHAVYL